MNPIQRSYLELLHLTQLFLLREYSIQETKVTEPHHFNFFQSKTKNSLPQPLIEKPLNPTVSLNPVPSSKNLTLKPVTSFTTPPKPLPLQAQPEIATSSLEVAQVQEKANKTTEISLEIPLTSPSPSQNYSDFWKVCQTYFPRWTLSKEIPDDAIALKNKNNGSYNQEIFPVMILSCEDNQQNNSFLSNLAHAISLRFARQKSYQLYNLKKMEHG